MSRTKKLFSFLFLITILASIPLFYQLKKARRIVIRTKTEPLMSAEVYPILLDQQQAMLGNPGAPLTVIEFVSFDNAKSRRLHATLRAFVNQHPQDIRLVWFDLPNRAWFGDPTLAHKAAWCALSEQRFWPLVDLIIMAKKTSSETQLLSLATQAGVNKDHWLQCLRSTAAIEHLQKDAAVARDLGIRSAPALFINNKKINSEEEFDLSQMLADFIAP